MALTPSQKRVAEYEWGYAGTRSYMGAPVTAETTTPGGAPVPTPVVVTGYTVTPASQISATFEERKLDLVPDKKAVPPAVRISMPDQPTLAHLRQMVSAISTQFVSPAQTIEMVRPERPPVILPRVPVKSTVEVAETKINIPERTRTLLTTYGAPRTYERGGEIITEAPVSSLILREPAVTVTAPSRPLKKGEDILRFGEPTMYEETISKTLKMLGIEPAATPEIISPLKTPRTTTLFYEEAGKVRPVETFFAVETSKGFIGGIATAPIGLLFMPSETLRTILNPPKLEDVAAGIRSFVQPQITTGALSPTYGPSFILGQAVGTQLILSGVPKLMRSAQDYFKPDIKPISFGKEAPKGLEPETLYRELPEETGLIKGKIDIRQRLITPSGKEAYVEKGSFIVFDKGTVAIFKTQRVGEMGTEVPTKYVGTAFKIIKQPDTVAVSNFIGKGMPAVKFEGALTETYKGISYTLRFDQDITESWARGVTKIKTISEQYKDIPLKDYPKLKGMFAAADTELIAKKAVLGIQDITTVPKLDIKAGVIKETSLTSPIAVSGGGRVIPSMPSMPTFFFGGGGLGIYLEMIPEWTKTAGAATLAGGYAAIRKGAALEEKTIFIRPEVADIIGVKQATIRETHPIQETQPQLRIGLKTRQTAVTTTTTGLQTGLQTGMQTQLQTRLQTQQQTQLQTQQQTQLLTQQQTRLQTRMQTQLQTGLGLKTGIITGLTTKKKSRIAEPSQRPKKSIALPSARRGRFGVRAGLRSDILSLTLTGGRLLAKGKTPIGLHPRSYRTKYREFIRSAGLRIPTAQMLKWRSRKTSGRRRKGRRWI